MSEKGNSERSIDDILAMASDPAYHRVVTARVSFVPQELREEHARLDALLPSLVSDTIDAHPQRLATAQRIAEIEETLEESVVEFRFKAIGHRAWADLVRKYPPTKQQRTLDRNLDHDPDRFPYEAMAVSCVDPVMTPEQVKALESSEAVDVQSWTELWSACIRANVVDASPKSLAASMVLGSDAYVQRHTTTASPAASSLGES